MSGYGPVQAFSKSITSGITATSAYDLGGRAFESVYLEVPSMVSGTDFYIQGSSDGTTFRRVQTSGYRIGTTAVATITTGVTITTSSIDLGENAQNAFLFIPTMTSGTSVLLQVSHDDVTFRRVTHAVPNTASAQLPGDWSVSTMAADTARWVPLPVGIRYFKVEIATQQTDTTLAFKAISARANELNDFVIKSATTHRMVPIPNSFQYIKVELSTAMTDTTSTFKVICG